MKKLLSVVLAACMALCLCVPAFAAGSKTDDTVDVVVGPATVNGEEVKIVATRLADPKPVEDVRAEAKATMTEATKEAAQAAGLDLDKCVIEYDFDLHLDDGSEVPIGTPVTVSLSFKVVPCLVAHLKQDGKFEYFVVKESPATLTFDGTSPVYVLTMPSEAGVGGDAAGAQTTAGSPSAGTPISPKTGDMTMLYAGVVIMLASAAAVVVYKKKA